MNLRFAIDTTLATLPIRSASLVVFGLPLLPVVWFAVWPESWLVEHVIFEGHQRSTLRELRHLADLPNGTTLWQLDTAQITRAVERHPWVRSASVDILLPDTLKITVVEHTPTAILHLSETLVYVDDYGEPFLGVQPNDLDYPHLVDFEPELSRLHPDLGKIAIRDTLWLIDALDTRCLVSRDRISSVSFSRTAGLTVELGASRLLFGFEDLPGQLQRLSILLQEGVRLDQPLQIDLAPSSVAIVHPLPDRAHSPPAGG